MMDNADAARERDILAKAYNIVDALVAMAPAANFPAAIDGTQKNHIFRDLLDRVAEMGITPATFIAVHALAQCAEKIRDLPPDENSKRLDDFLFDTVKQSLGPEIHDHLREWTAGVQMDEDQLAQATPWAKLGAMSESLQHVNFFASPVDPQLLVQHPDILSGVIETQGRVAEACKDLGPELYGYYAGKLEEAVQAISKGPQRGSSGPGFAPG